MPKSKKKKKKEKKKPAADPGDEVPGAASAAHVKSKTIDERALLAFLCDEKRDSAALERALVVPVADIVAETAHGLCYVLMTAITEMMNPEGPLADLRDSWSALAANPPFPCMNILDECCGCDPAGPEFVEWVQDNFPDETCMYRVVPDPAIPASSAIRHVCAVCYEKIFQDWGPLGTTELSQEESAGLSCDMTADLLQHFLPCAPGATALASDAWKEDGRLDAWTGHPEFPACVTTLPLRFMRESPDFEAFMADPIDLVASDQDRAALDAMTEVVRDAELVSRQQRYRRFHRSMRDVDHEPGRQKKDLMAAAFLSKFAHDAEGLFPQQWRGWRPWAIPYIIADGGLGVSLPPCTLYTAMDHTTDELPEWCETLLARFEDPETRKRLISEAFRRAKVGSTRTRGGRDPVAGDEDAARSAARFRFVDRCWRQARGADPHLLPLWSLLPSRTEIFDKAVSFQNKVFPDCSAALPDWDAEPVPGSARWNFFVDMFAHEKLGCPHGPLLKATVGFGRWKAEFEAALETEEGPSSAQKGAALKYWCIFAIVQNGMLANIIKQRAWLYRCAVLAQEARAGGIANAEAVREARRREEVSRDLSMQQLLEAEETEARRAAEAKERKQRQDKARAAQVNRERQQRAKVRADEEAVNAAEMAQERERAQLKRQGALQAKVRLQKLEQAAADAALMRVQREAEEEFAEQAGRRLEERRAREQGDGALQQPARAQGGHADVLRAAGTAVAHSVRQQAPLQPSALPPGLGYSPAAAAAVALAPRETAPAAQHPTLIMQQRILEEIAVAKAKADREAAIDAEVLGGRWVHHTSDDLIDELARMQEAGDTGSATFECCKAALQQKMLEEG